MRVFIALTCFPDDCGKDKQSNSFSLLSIVLIVPEKNVHNARHNVRKLDFGVSDQFQHKPSCTDTEEGWKLEI